MIWICCGSYVAVCGSFDFLFVVVVLYFWVVFNIVFACFSAASACVGFWLVCVCVGFWLICFFSSVVGFYAFVVAFFFSFGRGFCLVCFCLLAFLFFFVIAVVLSQYLGWNEVVGFDLLTLSVSFEGSFFFLRFFRCGLAITTLCFIPLEMLKEFASGLGCYFLLLFLTIRLSVLVLSFWLLLRACFWWFCVG